jgi:hypothetical protein
VAVVVRPEVPSTQTSSTSIATQDQAGSESTASIEDQLLRTRAVADYQRALINEFDQVVSEMQHEMTLDPGTALLAAAYRDQVTLMLEEQKSAASVARLACGSHLCVAEIVTPEAASLPDLRSSATRETGLGLSISARVSLSTPGSDTSTRILFAAMRSPQSRR